MNKYSEKEIIKLRIMLKIFYIFRKNNSKALVTLFNTIILYFLALFLLNYSMFGTILLTCVTIRTFIIFHDCGHRSFLKNLNYNRYLAKFLSTFVMQSAETWRSGHNHHHHNTHGNRNLIDYTKTVISLEEYNKYNICSKYLYLFLRNPPVFFTAIPFYIFFIKNLMDFNYLLKIFVTFMYY